MASASLELNSSEDVLGGSQQGRLARVPLTAAAGSEAGSSFTLRRTMLLHGDKAARHSHRIPASQYFALAVWIAHLLVQYAVARVACIYGIPHDCHDETDIARVLDDFEYLLFAGIVLAILTGVHWPDRFEYIFECSPRKPRGFVFVAVSVFCNVGWGCLDLVPFLSRFSLSGSTSGVYILLAILVAVGIAALVGLHFWMAYAHNDRAGFLAYTLSRIAVLSLYVAYFVIKAQHQAELRS
eukprot:TRINITY_DN10221_c0_g1_i3.p1 TRINITY_DN10221_c0_g1~~TRINITY_DN10221_c0_g1_i3.p1  ORF type:complete len:240 (-),score=11.37 TRINITY_DN10221_c0_g1_i3:131-850(-)